jgi:hypothetical protein
MCTLYKNPLQFKNFDTRIYQMNTFFYIIFTSNKTTFTFVTLTLLCYMKHILELSFKNLGKLKVLNN